MAATSQNLDSVTAATRLRRDTVEIQHELDEKRADYQRRMDHVKEQEERLKQDRAKLQDTLVQYYKYIQDNELKRSRANKKASVEEKAKQERFGQIKMLRSRIDELDSEKAASRAQYQQYIKYQKYLEEVLQFNESEEYQDPKDIIKRYETLDENRRILQRRKTQLEEDLARNQSQLQSKTVTNKSDTLQIDNKLSAAQGELEKIQQEIKSMQDQLESTVSHRTEITKTIGQIRMASQNLYDRCVEWNRGYNRSRAQKEASSTDLIHQLTVIGDCLGDYSALLKRSQDRAKERLVAANMTSGGGGALNGTTTAGAGAGAGAGSAQQLTTPVGAGSVAAKSARSNGNNNNNSTTGTPNVRNVPKPPTTTTSR